MAKIIFGDNPEDLTIWLIRQLQHFCENKLTIHSDITGRCSIREIKSNKVICKINEEYKYLEIIPTSKEFDVSWMIKNIKFDDLSELITICLPKT